VSFTVSASAPGSGTPTGNVTVSDGTDNCTGTVAAGFCLLASTTGGNKSLVASYAGDGNYATSTSAGVAHSVIIPGTTTTITGHTPSPSVIGQGVVVTYTVTSAAGGPKGNVNVTDGTDTCTGTVATGTCTLVPTTTGTLTLTATYVGSNKFGGSISAGVSHVVSPASTTTSITSDTPDPSVIGQQITVSVTVAIVESHAALTRNSG